MCANSNYCDIIRFGTIIKKKKEIREQNSIGKRKHNTLPIDDKQK